MHRWVVWGESLLSGASCRLDAAEVQLNSAVHHWGWLYTPTLSQRCLVQMSITLSSGTAGHYNSQDSLYCLIEHRWTLDVCPYVDRWKKATAGQIISLRFIIFFFCSVFVNAPFSTRQAWSGLEQSGFWSRPFRTGYCFVAEDL